MNTKSRMIVNECVSKNVETHGQNKRTPVKNSRKS